MRSSKKISLIFWISLTILLITLDAVTKQFAETHFENPFELWPGIFKLYLSHNTGVAFSIPAPNIVMIFTTPILMTAAVWLIIKNCRIDFWLTKFCLILFIAGGIGNLINRIFLGAIIDFINFSFWPSFNLADTYLTTGVLLIIIFYDKIMDRSAGRCADIQ